MPTRFWCERPFRGESQATTLRNAVRTYGACPRHRRLWLFTKRALATIALLVTCAVVSAETPSSQQYLDFVRAQAARLRADDRPPASQEEWDAARLRLRKNLLDAW